MVLHIPLLWFIDFIIDNHMYFFSYFLLIIFSLLGSLHILLLLMTIASLGLTFIRNSRLNCKHLLISQFLSNKTIVQAIHEKCTLIEGLLLFFYLFQFIKCVFASFIFSKTCMFSASTFLGLIINCKNVKFMAVSKSDGRYFDLLIGDFKIY